MISKQRLAAPRAILASFPSRKRFRPTISLLKTRNQFNFSWNLPQWKNSTTVERQRSLLRCRVARVKSRQVRAQTVSTIRQRHSRKIRMPKNRGRKVKTRYPQMNSIKLTLSARPRRKVRAKQSRPKRRRHCRSRICWTKVRCSLISLIARSKRSNKRALILNPKIH